MIFQIIWTRIASTFLVFGIGLVTAPGTQAAEIAHGGRPDMSCYLSLSGPIAAGDAERLDRALDTFLEETSRRDHPSVPRVSLNSESGDYNAAPEMIETLGGRFATAVGPGDICAGPCALVFMAGRPGDGGTLDTEQGGRILHPKAKLRFGEDGGPAPSVAQVARIMALRHGYDLPAKVIRLMLDDDKTARRVETVGQATRWQIRVAPTVSPEALSPLATWLACVNGTAPILPKLRFADWDYYDPDYPRDDTPVIRDGTTPEGRVTLRLSSNGSVTCGVIFFGPSDLPTGRVGTPRLTLGREDGLTLYRALYGPAFFTPDTPLSALARDRDDTPQSVSVSAQSTPQTTLSPGLCGPIKGGALTWHQDCLRTRHVAPSEDMSALITTTFETGEGTGHTAPSTGEYGRFWPQESDPVHTFDGEATEFYADGLPDEGDDGNEPGADTACRMVTDGRSEWCIASIWRGPESDEAFLFIAEDDYDSGLYYADQ